MQEQCPVCEGRGVHPATVHADQNVNDDTGDVECAACDGTGQVVPDPEHDHPIYDAVVDATGFVPGGSAARDRDAIREEHRQWYEDLLKRVDGEVKRKGRKRTKKAQRARQ